MTPEETQRLIDQAIARGAKMLPDSIRDISACFCGCGSPDVAWQWVLDYLARHGDEDAAKRWTAAETGPEWIAVYLMDHLDLTEHGTGIRGAWLTERGEEALAFLREHGPDWDEKGYFVDSEGCSHGDVFTSLV